MSEVLRRLRVAFERAGRTQAELADLVGVSQPAVSAWLRGAKTPDREKIGRLAAALGTTDAYLLGQQGSAPSSQKPDNAGVAASWTFDPLPPNGARDFGNAAMYAFTPTIETLVKEGGQNVGDVALAGLPAEARFRIIHLSGSDLQDFRAALQWDELMKHLRASADNQQKIGNIIRAGLERDKSLVLLALDDFGTAGMLGEDFEESDEANNFFVALARDTLNSTKFSQSAGGSFGLGKAVFTRVSQFATVLFNSNLSQPTRNGQQYNRLFGRTDLAYHRLGAKTFTGQGWFGIPQANGAVNSCWDNAELARRLYLDRGDRSGTSILVVGFIAGDEGERTAPNLKELAAQIENATVRYFWPAIASGQLDVSVETYQGHDKTSESRVQPKAIVPEFIDIYERGKAGDVKDKLAEEGDIVQFSIPLHVPRRRRGNGEKHGEVDHESLLFVRRSNNDASELARNQLAVFRGKEMIIKYIDLSRLERFAVPFQAVLMCGEAADSSVAARQAEQFLRSAEPPMHDDWIITPDMAELYIRGGGQAIKKMFDTAREKIREAVKVDFDNAEEGPRALSDLFKISKPPRGTTLTITDVRRVSDDRERIEVTVRVPLKDDAEWTTRPAVLCKTETGPDLRLDVSAIEAIRGASVQGDQLHIGGKVREAVFRLSPQWTSGAVESAAMAEALKRNAVLSVELRDVK